MNKVKKSNAMIRLVVALAIVMMFTLCFVGGTFAKYTSTGTGSDSTNVAKWSFKVGGTDIATATENFTFELFKDVKDSNGTNPETEIKLADGSIIAPGTSGSFALVLKNESEVTAQYAIDYTVTNDNTIPVKFSVDGGNTWTADLVDVVADDATKLAVGSEKTITVQWMWDFNGNDTTDTALGILGHGATLTVSAVVTATQVD